MDATFAAELGRRTAEYGVDIVVPGSLGSLEDGGRREGHLHYLDGGGLDRVLVSYNSAMTLTSIPDVSDGADDRVPLLVLGPHVSARSSAAFRSAGVNFFDAAGNAFVRLPGILIDVRGRRDTQQPGTRSTVRPANLFSTKRAQVIFCLISWPELLDAPIRVIAQHARVSVGMAQGTIELLRYAGYLDRWPSPSSLRRLPDLIDRWTSAFPLGLGSPTRAKSFLGDLDCPLQIADGVVAYLSGEAAVNDLHGTTITVYVDEWSPPFARLNGWRSDRDPNILVRQVFWSDPGQQPGRQAIQKAPPLLVYADLLAGGEGRQRDAARSTREVNPDLRAS